MSNRLKVAMLQALVTLWQRRWSNRRIARELGIDRATVGRYVRQLEALANAAKVHIGSAGAANPAIVHTGSAGGGDASSGSPSDPGLANPAILHTGVQPGQANAAQVHTGFGAAQQPNAANVHIGSANEAELPRQPGAALPEANPAKVHIGSSDVRSASGAELQALVEFLRQGGAGGNAKANPAAKAPRGVCAPFAEIIQAKLDQGLSLQRIHQDLRSEHGFGHSYHSVRRFVQRLHPHAPPPFRRIEVEPGSEAQVDFGKGAVLVGPDGRRQHTHVFRLVLSHSRKAYSEAVTRQTTEAFLGCLENAFRHFGGVPKTIVLDNLRAAVKKADWFDPDLVPKAQAFAAHYGTVFLPTKPRLPRHKGKVERGIDYVQENALKGHTFASLHLQNQHLLEWEQAVADTRIHGTTRRQVGKVFAEVERPALLALPAERFPDFREAERTVHRDGHVEVDKAYYSVPPEYLGRRVWVRWDTRLVRIFNQRFTQIALHARHWPGSFSTHDAHVPTTKHNAIDRGAQALLAQARQLGVHTGAWAQAMLQQRGLAGLRVLLGLLSLAKRHAAEQLDAACHAAHQHGAYRLRTVRQLLARRSASSQQEFAFLDRHPIIRDLTAYGQCVTVPCPEPGRGGRGTSGPSFPAPQTPHPSFPLSVPPPETDATVPIDIPVSPLVTTPGEPCPSC